MILSDIIKAKRGQIERSKKRITLEYIKHRLSRKNIVRRNFKHAISQANNINIIAEIKKASPTRGLIREDFDVRRIARECQINGAAAISVLTEEDFFKGRLNYIKQVKKVTNLPVIRKDFIIDEYQVYESVSAGADAVLLIASLLKTETLREFISIAGKFSMDCVVEAHSRGELDKALEAGAEIIGINNRNLTDFSIDMGTTKNLAPFVPKKKVVISESGFSSKFDFEPFRGEIDAVLVGTAILKSQDREALLKELSGKA